MNAQRVSLSDLLTFVRRKVEVVADQQYREIGVRSYGRGLFHKEPRSGLEVGNKDLFLVHEGDFILQVTFAWEGAVAVAKAADHGLYGSVRMLTFCVDETLCLPEYLQLYFRTPEGVEQLVRISPGSAGRNRVLNKSRLSEVFVPLPPLAEQRRIVAKIERLAGKIEEARRLREQASFGVNSLFPAAAGRLIETLQETQTVRLGEIADIRSGVTLGRNLTGPLVELPYLRVANVQDGFLDLDHVKTVFVRAEEQDKWRLQDGDVLLTEGGDWDKLGRGTVWRDEIPDCIHQNHVFCVRLDRTRFDPDYLIALTRSPYGKAYFQSASKQTTNLATINRRQLGAFPVLDLSLDEQAQFVGYLDGIHTKAEYLQSIQANTSAELDALLPAILDRAFKGEL